MARKHDTYQGYHALNRIPATKPTRILLLENNQVAARSLLSTLRAGGAIVDHVGDVKDVLNVVKQSSYRMIVLGLPSPGAEIRDIVSLLWAAKIDIPVLILSCLALPKSGPNAADGKMAVSAASLFDLMELTGRAEQGARQNNVYSEVDSLQIGNLIMQPHTQSVTINGNIVALTTKEFSILELLIQFKGQLVTRDHVLHHLYNGFNRPVTKIIDVFVCELRKKLARAGAASLIGTVWGRGYIIQEAGHEYGNANHLGPHGNDRLSSP